MPNLNKLKTLSLKSVPGLLKNHMSLMFWLVLLVLLAFEGLAFKVSVNMVLDAQKAPPMPVQSRGIRINFKDYNDMVKKIENAQNFVPTPEAWADPFSGRRNSSLAVPSGLRGGGATTTDSVDSGVPSN
jgi:hypothetical protein